MCREMSDYPPFYGILCMAFYGQFKGEISDIGSPIFGHQRCLEWSWVNGAEWICPTLLEILLENSVLSPSISSEDWRLMKNQEWYSSPCHLPSWQRWTSLEMMLKMCLQWKCKETSDFRNELSNVSHSMSSSSGKSPVLVPSLAVSISNGIHNHVVELHGCMSGWNSPGHILRRPSDAITC